MKSIDKLAIALVIAWVLQAALTPLLPHSYVYLGIERVVFGAICGGWAYSEAKAENETAWLWGLVGFFGSVSGLILFYVYMLWQQSASRKKAANQQSPDRTAPSATPPATQEPRH